MELKPVKVEADFSEEELADARKVLSDLLDEKSFVEILKNFDKGVICGYGTINLRPVCIS